MDALGTLKDVDLKARADELGIDISEFRGDLDRKLRHFHTDQVDSAVITPDAETRALTSFGLQKGTAMREMAQFFVQFKALLKVFDYLVRILIMVFTDGRKRVLRTEPAA